MRPSILASLVCLALAGTARAEPDADANAQVCTPDVLFAEARAGLARGSPALRAYLRALLQEQALVMPNDVLLRELARASEPEMIEALGSALAHKAEMTGDASLVGPLLLRATQDNEPAQRAAAVRALRGTGSTELMKAARVDVDYERLIRDEAPAVREAAVENLVVEDNEVYSGHSPELAEAAFRAADASEDPVMAARLIAETSTEGVSAERGASLARTLRSDDMQLRIAAARALGGVPPAFAGEAVDALVARYHADDALEVRREILSSLARLLRGRAAPVLDALRTVDARLASDIDAWITVLQRGLPEWQLVVREKNRH